MSKELEALKIGIPKLKKLYENSAKEMSSNDILGFDFTFSYLDKALQRLEAIDNSNPNEALEIIRKCENSNYLNTWYPRFVKDLKTIKQALIKAQEQEKVLDILKSKKYIPLDRLNPRFWNDKETYNEVVNYEYYLWLCKEVCPYVVKEEQKLTQEEFNSIKEMTKDE